MKRLLTWTIRAGFSILDQGLVSVANFGLSVVLARLLAPDAYGAFSISFATFLVASVFHNALVIEPMSVLGPANHSGELVPYIGRVLRLHFFVTIPLAIVGAVLSLFFFGTSLGRPLFGMSLCLPFLLLFWTTRRAHYLEAHADLAASSSFLYCFSLTALIAIARQLGFLNVTVSFIAMAAASVFASLFSLRSLGVGLRMGQAGRRELALAFREHWSFGKWILPSGLLYPLVSQVQTFAAGALLGLSAAGVLRALQNPIMPAIQVVIALGLLAIPALARNFGEGFSDSTYRRGLMYTIAMSLLAVGYELGLVVTGGQWDILFYRGRYASWDFLMPILGLVPVASAITAGCSVILRAVQRPALITAANLVGGLFGVASIYPFIKKWQVAGAVYGLLGSQIMAAAASVALVFFAKSHPVGKKSAPVLPAAVRPIVFSCSESTGVAAENS